MILQGDDIGLTALGLISPIGYCAETACASARANLNRLGEIDLLNSAGIAALGEGPAVGHCVRLVGHGSSGYAKAALLAEHALSEVLRKRRLTDEEQSRTSISVVLTDRYFEDRREAAARATREGLTAEPSADPADEEVGEEAGPTPSAAWRSKCARWLPELLERVGLSIAESRRTLLFGGHASIVGAIETALESITVGAVDRALVGGVDSLVEPAAYMAAAEAGVIASESNPAGFFPSEAAAFFLLERGRPLAVVRAWATSGDEARMSETPALGMGTADCIRQVLDAAPRRGDVGLVMADLNGDVFRARDWGHAVVRLSGTSNVRDCPVLLPAVSFGETGAACGALATVYAARGFQRSYWPAASSVLICLASDSGARGVLLLEPGAC